LADVPRQRRAARVHAGYQRLHGALRAQKSVRCSAVSPLCVVVQ
jgi:hypothetical protein